MLAQNFKTATDLGISDSEFAGLSHVLGRLERGELRHIDHTGDVIGDCFNMGTEGQRHLCGTIACIGGWVATYMGQTTTDEMEEYVDRYMDGGALHTLYWSKTGGDVTTEQAAIALRNFLTTGSPRWDEATADAQ